MKDKEEDIEQILLNNASLDDLIKARIEKEFREAEEKSKKKPKPVNNRHFKSSPKFDIFKRKRIQTV